MRFLCENCKAKYQIADEKLAGRAVRMKCRKCGHIIDVPSSEAKAVGIAASASPLPPPATVEAPRPAPRPAPAEPAGAAPRPPRPAATAPPPRARIDAPLPPPAVAPSVAAAIAPLAVAEPLASPLAGGLAGAFSKSVRGQGDADVSASIEVLSAGAGEEWYVGISGVPLGPVRLSTIREKAAQHLIDEDSLVWREGFEEWLPLRTFPELLALLHEARDQAPRPSLSPSAPPQAQALSVAARPAPRAALAGIDLSPTAARAPAADPNGAAVAPPPAAGIFEVPLYASPPSPFGDVQSDPFAAPAPLSAAMFAGPATAATRGESISTRPSVPPDDSLSRRSVVDDLALGMRRQVRMHPAAYVLIALAGGFGVTAAIVLFTADKTPPPAPTIQYVTVAAPVTNAPAGTAAGETNPAGSSNNLGEVAVAGGTRVAGPLPGGSADPGGKASSGDPTAASTPPPRVGLGDGPNVAGPTVGGPVVGGGVTAQLEQADIERVVSSQRASVKRRCWEPALSARDPKAPPSAKVGVSATIGPDGRVKGATASGGDGYPGLAACVQRSVQGWTFPPSGGESRANIPFAFFSQSQ